MQTPENIIQDDQSEQSEQKQCNLCDSMPDNYVSLNCGHNFCLVCMAYRFLKGALQNSDNNSINFACEICEEITDLDQQSVAAIDLVIKEIILANQAKLQQKNQQNQLKNLENSSEKEINQDDQISIQESDEDNQKIISKYSVQQENFVDDEYEDDTTSIQIQQNLAREQNEQIQKSIHQTPQKKSSSHQQQQQQQLQQSYQVQQQQQQQQLANLQYSQNQSLQQQQQQQIFLKAELQNQTQLQQKLQQSLEERKENIIADAQFTSQQKQQTSKKSYEFQEEEDADQSLRKLKKEIQDYEEAMQQKSSSVPRVQQGLKGVKQQGNSLTNNNNNHHQQQQQFNINDFQDFNQYNSNDSLSKNSLDHFKEKQNTQQISVDDFVNQNNTGNNQTNNYDFAQKSNRKEYSEKQNQQIQQNFCQEHTFEELTFFCFTCENKMMCLRCMQNDSSHLNHDIRNFDKGVKLLKQKMEETKHQINANMEILLWNEKKTSEKKRNLNEKSQKIKKAIKDNIAEIIEKLKKKETELVTEVDLNNQQKATMLESQIQEMQAKSTALSHLQESFTLLNKKQNNSNTTIQIFKFFSECKTMLNQITSENEELFQMSMNNNTQAIMNNGDQITNNKNGYFAWKDGTFKNNIVNISEEDNDNFMNIIGVKQIFDSIQHLKIKQLNTFSFNNTLLQQDAHLNQNSLSQSQYQLLNKCNSNQQFNNLKSESMMAPRTTRAISQKQTVFKNDNNNSSYFQIDNHKLKPKIEQISKQINIPLNTIKPSKDSWLQSSISQISEMGKQKSIKQKANKLLDSMKLQRKVSPQKNFNLLDEIYSINTPIMRREQQEKYDFQDYQFQDQSKIRSVSYQTTSLLHSLRKQKDIFENKKKQIQNKIFNNFNNI